MKTKLAALWVGLSSFSLTGMGCSVAPASESPDTRVEHVTNAPATPPDASAPGSQVSPACTEPGRYFADDGVTVVDHANDARVWQRYVSETLFTQPEGVAYCAQISLGRRTAWRLPTAIELNTLKLKPPGIKGDRRSCAPSIDQSAFPDTPKGAFWTSTLRSETGDAISVGFDDGRGHPATLDTPMYVRCVSDP